MFFFFLDTDKNEHNFILLLVGHMYPWDMLRYFLRSNLFLGAVLPVSYLCCHSFILANVAVQIPESGSCQSSGCLGGKKQSQKVKKPQPCSSRCLVGLSDFKVFSCILQRPWKKKLKKKRK